MKMKATVTLILFILLICGFQGSLPAQSVITGTLLGYDDKPLKKCLVLMSVGGPKEKTIIIQTDHQGRFRHETHEKGLHFLNFVGVRHQQEKVVLYIDEAREVTLNVRLGRQYYEEDLAQASYADRTPNRPSTERCWRSKRMEHTRPSSYQQTP